MKILNNKYIYTLLLNIYKYNHIKIYINVKIIINYKFIKLNDTITLIFYNSFQIIRL